MIEKSFVFISWQEEDGCYRYSIVRKGGFFAESGFCYGCPDDAYNGALKRLAEVGVGSDEVVAVSDNKWIVDPTCFIKLETRE